MSSQQLRRFRIAAIAWLATLAVALAAHASPQWLAPVRLSPGEIALGPEIALNPGGGALVVWDHEVGDVCPDQPANPACVHIVEAVSQAPGTRSWSAPGEVARPGIDSRPQVALDRSGNAIVLWVHDIGDDRALQASYRRGGTTVWPEPIDLSEITRRIGAHVAALDAAGNAVVAWAAIDSSGRTVILAKDRAAASGVWGGQAALSRADGDAPGGPSLAVNAAGDAVAAWTLAGSNGRVVQAAFRPAASGVWSAPTDLSAPGADLDPNVAIDAAGDAVAVWSRGAVESAFRPAGGAWSAPVGVSASLPRRGDPRVALDPNGNAVAVWAGGSGVQAAARPRSSGAWSAPADLSGANAASPRLALDATGNAVAVWTDARGTAQSALRPAASGRWLPAVDVSAAGVRTSEPRVLADAAGNALAVWNRIDPPRAAVEAADLAGSGPVISTLNAPSTGTARVAIPFSVVAVPWASPLAGPPAWTFGDGGSATGANVSHSYAAPGRFTVTVTQADAVGATASASAVISITAATLRNTVRPSIRGRARVGATLICARGSWSGTPPIRYAYRWLRGGRPIPRAAAQQYRARTADAGALVACRVTAMNAAGSRTAFSRPVRLRG